MDRRFVYATVAVSLFFAVKILLWQTTFRNDLVTDLTSALKCTDIDLQIDKCAFVQSACTGYSAMYLHFYYCSTLWTPFKVIALLAALALLFGAVSVAASDFFCPNLQTIAHKLKLSESLAGVTVLAFGNGSTDLFSTFSAMDSGAGSLAIGELIGAAFFITAVVTGSMGIIRSFRCKPITFIRDASYLTGAISMLTWIVYHGQIHWYHGLILIAYYISYVMVVLYTVYHPTHDTMSLHTEFKSDNVPPITHIYAEESTETTRLLSASGRDRKPPRLSIPDHGFAVPVSHASDEHVGYVLRPVSPRSASHQSLRIDNLHFPRTTSTSGSIATPRLRRPLSPRVGIRTSLFSAIEFQDQVRAIRRANSSSYVAPTHQQISMPNGMWQRSSTQAMISPQVPTQRRPRSSTSNGMITLAPRHAHAASPESSHSTGGVAEDYFTFLSAQPPQRQNTQRPHPDDRLIPEIRLAPPNPTDHHLTIPSPVSQAPVFYTPLATSPRPEVLSVPVSPNPSARSDSNETFVSALQSPLQSPIPSRLSATYLTPSPSTPELASTPCMSMLGEISHVLFPTLQGWTEKSWLAKFSSLIAVPIVLVFTLTLPVADPESFKTDECAPDDGLLPRSPTKSTQDPSRDYLAVPPIVNEIIIDDDTGSAMTLEPSAGLGWCRWLLAVQAIASLAFVTMAMSMNDLFSFHTVYVAMVFGCILAAVIMVFTKADEPPSWYWTISFAGFIIALNWIILLADEMVGLLQALGKIFGISEAIMGLTIFALGNSLGDLVTNTAIAKMGFPTMAISACYGGPLLNTVLGVGVSATYQTWKRGVPYQLDISPTILVFAGGLLLALVSTLLVVYRNGYCITRQLECGVLPHR